MITQIGVWFVENIEASEIEIITQHHEGFVKRFISIFV